ncbi:MAG: hypothetical protein V4615_11530 [Bacteroidota bacterium]
MLNTTKLELLLPKHPLSFDIYGDGRFILLLTEKSNNYIKQFEGQSYCMVLGVAYSFFLRELKKEEK